MGWSSLWITSVHNIPLLNGCPYSFARAEPGEIGGEGWHTLGNGILEYCQETAFIHGTQTLGEYLFSVMTKVKIYTSRNITDMIEIEFMHSLKKK